MKENALIHQGLGCQNGELMIEDLPISTIAAKVPTPVYIYSVTRIKELMTSYKETFVSSRFNTQVYYASKAFNILGVLEIAKECGLGVDVVSAGELYTALKAGYDPAQILFHGNNKTEAELRMALENRIGTIVLDNIQEARNLALLKSEYPDADPKMLLRINPGISAHTHEYIVTGHIDSKFGVSKLNLDEAVQIARILKDAGYGFDGFHCHIGSQIFDNEAFRDEISVMAGFIEEFEKVSSIPVHILDLGGGFASWYTEEDKPTNPDEVSALILKTCEEVFKEGVSEIDTIWIEPGRSIIANAGLQLYTIGAIKKTPNKLYYFVDGGMSDNIRPALYQAEYSCDLPLKMDEEEVNEVCVAGKCCESGDIIVPSAMLPAAVPGDLLAVYTTGAYGYSMASRYNKMPVPGVLFVEKDKAWYAVRPESLNDLLRNECHEEVI